MSTPLQNINAEKIQGNLSINSVSATTYYNLPSYSFTGGTVSGTTNFTAGLSATTIYSSGLTANTIYTDYIDFNTNYTPTQQEGRIHWDADYGTLDVDLEGNNINLKIGLDNLYYIKNQSGATINKGRVVRAAGALGASGRILGEYMIADGSIPYYYTLGIAGENILDGEDGYIYEFGLIKGIDTTGSLYGETWSDGTILYVHPTIAGGLTSVEPTEPNLKIQIGIVINSDSNGSIFVRPSLGYNLGDLHNLQTSGQTNGDLISYDDSNEYWNYSKTLNGSYTITGDTTVGGQMKANSVSATTYYNLPIDVRVTGATYSNNEFTYTNNTGGTFNVLFNTVTGLTVNGSMSANDVYVVSATTGTSVGNLAIQSDGKIIKAGGNAIVDNFYYSISNTVDTRPIFEDDKVLFNWDETGNDLEFQMKVAPDGSGDMRASAYLYGGGVQSTAIVSTGVDYDLWAAGVAAGNRIEAFITAENDVTYPAYRIIVFNTGESFHNTIWIERITRI